jgi:hypothetical protein
MLITENGLCLARRKESFLRGKQGSLHSLLMITMTATMTATMMQMIHTVHALSERAVKKVCTSILENKCMAKKNKILYVVRRNPKNPNPEARAMNAVCEILWDLESAFVEPDNSVLQKGYKPILRTVRWETAGIRRPAHRWSKLFISPRPLTDGNTKGTVQVHARELQERGRSSTRQRRWPRTARRSNSTTKQATLANRTTPRQM